MARSGAAGRPAGLRLLLAAVGLAAAAAVPLASAAWAQAEGAAEPGTAEPAAAPPKAKTKKSHRAEADAKHADAKHAEGRHVEGKRGDAKRNDGKPAEPREAPAPAGAAPAAPPTLAAAAASGAATGALDIAGKLTQAGAGACSAAIDAEAVSSMIGVTQSNIVTTWSNVEPRDRHAVNVFVAQRYGNNAAVPFGVTGLIASPNASGSCDSTVVQVVTSPLPCASVRDTLLRAGKMEGDLAGVALVRSGADQTLLMPTATNSCVLIGFHSTFRS